MIRVSKTKKKGYNVDKTVVLEAIRFVLFKQPIIFKNSL
jgi:hypothetical protein